MGTTEQQCLVTLCPEKKYDNEVSETLCDQLQARLKPGAEANALDAKLKEVRRRTDTTQPRMWMVGGGGWVNGI